jgi:hypothetical protein
MAVLVSVKGYDECLSDAFGVSPILATVLIGGKHRKASPMTIFAQPRA